MKTFFTSDLHFHHKKITEFTERKLFTDSDHHNQWLIDTWNKQVNKGDVVYILGDFSFSRKYEEVLAYLRRLNGRKFIIKGNHDRSKILDSLKLSSGTIQNWWDYKEIKLSDNTPACLFHFPISSWHRQHYGAFMLHGHCHGSFQGQGKILDVGIDNAYKLFGEHRLFIEEDVIEYLQTRQLAVVDHHKIT